MYAYIRGKLDYKASASVIVEAGGVGYKIFTPFSTYERAGEIGSEIKVFTYYHVREDAICLYGFLSEEELGMFTLVLSVSGIGPKIALSLVGNIPPSRFGYAVITEDAMLLSKTPGVGGKTAQRIILELKDKIKKERLLTQNIPGMSGKPGMDDSRDFAGSDAAAEADGTSFVISEAISALMVLGYTSFEAGRAVGSVYKVEDDLETIIRNALKGMIRNRQNNR
ncbi:MAG: Holliday junction branch migration protein RuvA [Clostridiales bacterium]|nr:Holliday junction branch migration protein RuvA [Clostridiales bacterium]